MYYSYSWTIPNTNTTLFTLTDETYTLELSVPGFGKEDIEVAVEDDNVISVEGVSEKYGEFAREYYLPEDISVDKISATVTNGILTITGPKEEKPRNRITVR